MEYFFVPSSTPFDFQINLQLLLQLIRAIKLVRHTNTKGFHIFNAVKTIFSPLYNLFYSQINQTFFLSLFFFWHNFMKVIFIS